MTAAAASIFPAAPAGPLDRLRTGLAASLALHAALLAWLAAPVLRQEAPPAARLITRLLPRLPPPLPAEPPAETSSPDAPRIEAAPRRAPVTRPDAAGAEAGRSEQGAAALPAAPPLVNAEAARRLARELAKGLAAPKPGGPVVRGDTPEAVLARRLQRGEPRNETRMADGSVLLRFSDGACALVPAQLQPFARNDFGPTLIVTTNCPGTISF